uniref:Uncharacterized protein n=1 Tax=Parascaris univalens TaxID=6257 RepID=A0A915BJD7_PARUN
SALFRSSIRNIGNNAITRRNLHNESISYKPQ